MGGHIAVMITGLLAAAPSESPSLPEVLQRLGAEQRRAEDAGTCAFKERSTIEELDTDGVAKGKLQRVYSVVRSPTGTDRKLLEEEQSGELSSAFTATPKDPSPEERKRQRGPFHPEEQAHYRFALVKATEERLVVSFEPLKRDEKKMKGTVEIDPATFALRSMTAVPSKLPTFVDDLQIQLRFASTPCGVQPVSFDFQGKAGLLFVKKRFRTRTRFLEYATTK